MGSRPLAMIAAALLALVAGTCQSDDDADDTSPTTDRTTTTVSPEAEVEAAYLAFWDMAVRLAESPNPDDPEIAQRASGDALADLVNGLRALQSQNQHSEFGPEYGHEVLSTEIDGETAIVEDCAVDDSKIVNVETGEIAVEGVGTQRLSVTLRRSDGDWVVDKFDQLDAWTGAVACT
jgi:hypothetical protein